MIDLFRREGAVTGLLVIAFSFLVSLIVNLIGLYCGGLDGLIAFASVLVIIWNLIGEFE